ncbi:MAG: hypothetical protein ABJG78_20445 [Cyclobacteriaceae bacterium]
MNNHITLHLVRLTLAPICVVLVISGCVDGNRNRHLDSNLAYGKLNPEAPRETFQFGQLVGKWDVISSDSIPNEGWHESKATWTFMYTLDGFAVQDIWHEKVSDSTSNTKGIGRDFTGINVRVFDPNTKQWNITWFENGTNTMQAVITAKTNMKGEIVMKPPNYPAEITFYNIAEHSFDWKFEILKEDKRILFSKMSAKRSG